MRNTNDFNEKLGKQRNYIRHRNEIAFRNAIQCSGFCVCVQFEVAKWCGVRMMWRSMWWEWEKAKRNNERKWLHRIYGQNTMTIRRLCGSSVKNEMRIQSYSATKITWSVQMWLNLTDKSHKVLLLCTLTLVHLFICCFFFFGYYHLLRCNVVAVSKRAFEMSGSQPI